MPKNNRNPNEFIINNAIRIVNDEPQNFHINPKESKTKLDKDGNAKKYTMVALNTQIQEPGSDKARWIYVNGFPENFRRIDSTSPETVNKNGDRVKYENVGLKADALYPCIDVETKDKFRMTGEEIGLAVEHQREVYRAAHPRDVAPGKNAQPAQAPAAPTPDQTPGSQVADPNANHSAEAQAKSSQPSQDPDPSPMF